MECQFCLKKFSNKFTLQTHQKKAKYCLKIQEQMQSVSFRCTYCMKNLSSKYRLNMHLNVCKQKILIDDTHIIHKYESKIKELTHTHEQYIYNLEQKYESKIKYLEQKYESEIKDLHNKIQDICLSAINRPTTTNYKSIDNSTVNQIINKLTSIKVEDIQENSQYLTIDHIKDGGIGYSRFALEYPLKDKIICVDFSRRKLKYRDENGNIIDDPEMSKLATKFFCAIDTQNDKLINQYLEEISNTLYVTNNNDNNNMTKDETDLFLTQTNSLCDEIFKIRNIKRDIEDIKHGNKPELLIDFVKNICLKTY